VVLGGEDADSEHRGAAQLLRCAVTSPMARREACTGAAQSIGQRRRRRGGGIGGG
jgi:hypothetical protein